MSSLQLFFAQYAQPLIWLAVALLLLIIEAATVQMVCIWFCVGAVCAVITALLGGSVTVQVIVFAVVSVLALVFTRRFVRDVLKVKKTPTNADSVIGATGLVLEEINNEAETGRVHVEGLDWTARTGDGSIIPAGATVSVTAIAGVKLIVTLVKNKEE